MIVYDMVKGRTVDTGSGVYLAPNNGRAGEQIWGFTVVDGETRIAVSADSTASRLGPGKYLVEYDLEAAPVLLGWPRRSGYAALIGSLIAAHAEFAERHRLGGREIEVDVTFAPRFLDKLADWEAVHGFAPTDACC